MENVPAMRCKSKKAKVILYMHNKDFPNVKRFAWLVFVDKL